MGNLDKKYIIRLDTKNTFFNPTLNFSMSDTKTSDFYIRVTDEDKIINIDNIIPVITLIDPNGKLHSDFMTVENGLLYYDLKQSDKNIAGKWIGRVLLLDGKERIVLKGTFSYLIDNDEFMHLNKEEIKLSIKNMILESLKFNANNLKDKTWAVVGDSLTEINEATTKHYYDYISEETGIKVINYGVGGTGYMRGCDSSNAFYQRVLNISSDVDIITIFGSGNDLGRKVGIDKLGDITDTGTDTICGCINKALDNLFTKFPMTPIGVISPTPWYKFPTTALNNDMELYVQKIELICKRRGVKYLDLYHSSLLRPEDETNRNLYFYNKTELDGNGDGIHLNELGHKIIYPAFREFLKSMI